MLAALTLLALASKPILIAHRGASGVRPEHTLEAYRVAIAQGADYIEPDLVFTKDGILVARHENEISGTTDVAAKPEFAARKTSKTIDGTKFTGWFTEDFTLAELKTLRTKERLPMIRKGNVAYDGKFEVPTFQEVIDLAKAEGKRLGREIGLYPETKHPSYFAGLGLPFDDVLLEQLQRNGYAQPDSPVFIQSFEIKNLKAMRAKTKLRLIQLMDSVGGPEGESLTYAQMATPEGLREVRTYADGVGISKALIFPKGTEPTNVIDGAKRAGLQVHVWTFRNEDMFLPADLKGDPEGELRRYIALGIDGLFTDFPETAFAVRNTLPMSTIPQTAL